jgi:hypothetical protein
VKRAAETLRVSTGTQQQQQHTTTTTTHSLTDKENYYKDGFHMSQPIKAPSLWYLTVTNYSSISYISLFIIIFFVRE